MSQGQPQKNVERFRMVVKGKEIQTQNGPKNMWNEIGQISVFSQFPIPDDLSFSIEINHMPGAQVNGFKRQQNQQQGQYQQPQGQQQYNQGQQGGGY